MTQSRNKVAQDTKEYSAAWRIKNKEKVKDYAFAWRAANAGRVAAYRVENKDAIAATIAVWRAENKDKVKGYGSTYYEANKDKIKARVSARSAVTLDKKKVRSTTLTREKHSAREHLRRARLREVESECVLISVLFERDNGICGICEKEVFKNAEDVFMRPSHDHILPVSHGGANTYANARLVHRRCNIARGNHGAAQLRLL